MQWNNLDKVQESGHKSALRTETINTLNIVKIDQTVNKDAGVGSRSLINPGRPHHYFRTTTASGAFSITFARKSKCLKVNGGR